MVHGPRTHSPTLLCPRTQTLDPLDELEVLPLPDWLVELELPPPVPKLRVSELHAASAASATATSTSHGHAGPRFFHLISSIPFRERWPPAAFMIDSRSDGQATAR